MNANNDFHISYFQSKTYEMLSPQEKEVAKNEFIDRTRSKFFSLKALEKIDIFGIFHRLGLYRKDSMLGDTIVHDVVKLDDKELFNVIFKDGCPLINSVNREGNTPLFETVLRGNVELAKELLNSGAIDSINVANRKGFTPLFAAVSRKDPVLVQLLLEAGALPKGKFGESEKSLLQFASTLKDSTITKLLLKHGMKDQVLVKDTRHTREGYKWTRSEGHSPLQRAIVAGCVDNVAAMLEDNPEVVKSLNIPDNGITPLMLASRSGNIELMSLLLKKLTDQNIITSREGFFTEQELETCQAEALKNLDTIPIQSIAFPLVIAQNNCNVMVALNNGKILKLPNADAKQIKDFIMNKKYGTTGDTEAPNVLTLYLSPGHGFLRLECSHCNSDKPYNMNKGFYPTGKLVPQNVVSPEEISMIFTVTNKIRDHVDYLMGSVKKVLPNVGQEEAKNEVINAYSGLTKDHFGNLQDDTEYEYSSDATNALKVMFYIDDEQAKAALSTIKDVQFSCSQNPEKSCYYNALNRNCVDFANEVFTSIGGQGYFADFFSNDQLNYGHLESPDRLWEFKAVNWGYIQSRGIPYYLASGVYQGINNIFNRVLSHVYPANDLLIKSFPTEFKFQTLNETIAQTRLESDTETSISNSNETVEQTSSIELSNAYMSSSIPPSVDNITRTTPELSAGAFFLQQDPTSLVSSSQSLLDSAQVQRPTQSLSESSVNLTSYLMLAAVVTTLAIDTLKKISEISTFLGEKVTDSQYSKWQAYQKERMDNIFKGLDEIEEFIDGALENIAEDINGIKKNKHDNLKLSGLDDSELYSQEKKIQLEIYNDEKSKWQKIDDKYIDVSFSFLKIKEKMKRLADFQDLPSVNYLEKLNTEISELNIAYHEIRAQIELLAEI